MEEHVRDECPRPHERVLRDELERVHERRLRHLQEIHRDVRDEQRADDLGHEMPGVRSVSGRQTCIHVEDSARGAPHALSTLGLRRNTMLRTTCLAAMGTLLALPISAQSVQYRSAAGVAYRAQTDTGPIARADSALKADPRNVDRVIALGVAQSGARQF